MFELIKHFTNSIEHAIYLHKYNYISTNTFTTIIRQIQVDQQEYIRLQEDDNNCIDSLLTTYTSL